MGILDAITLTIIAIVVAAIVAFILWVAALPGQIAASRAPPLTDAIACCGWLSLLTLFTLWPVAMIWAYTRPLNVAIDQEGSSAGGNVPRGGAKQ